MVTLVYTRPPDRVALTKPERPKFYPKHKVLSGDLLPWLGFDPKKATFKGGYLVGPDGERLVRNEKRIGKVARWMYVTMNELLRNTTGRRVNTMLQALKEYWRQPDRMTGAVTHYPVKIKIVYRCDLQRFQHDVDNRMSLYVKTLIDVMVEMSILPDDKPWALLGVSYELVHDFKKDQLTATVKSVKWAAEHTYENQPDI